MAVTNEEMRRTRPSRLGRLGRRALTSAALIATAAAVAACGSSSKAGSSGSTNAASSGSTPTSTGGTSTTGSPAQAGVQYAEKKVAAGRANPQAPVPSAAVSNLAAFKGKTIYYIPISSDVPAFAITGATMKAAGAKIGVKVVICNGNFNPSGWTGCFTQAMNAGPAAIVTDSIAYQVIQKQIIAANAKGIGVYVTDQIPFKGHPQGKHIAFLNGAQDQYPLTMDWVIANSQGKAHVLMLEATDAATSAMGTSKFALGELKAHCPDCTETMLKFTNSNENQLPSLVSAALLKNPDINYIYAEYDQYTQLVQQGLQQASKTSGITVVASAAALAGLKDVQDGSLVKAEVADNQVYNGYIDLDNAMRLANGQKPIDYYVPIRLFDSQNIGSIKLTSAGQSDGSWFGPLTYTTKFTKLWNGS